MTSSKTSGKCWVRNLEDRKCAHMHRNSPMDSSGVTCHCRAIQNEPSCQSWYTPHVLTHGGQDISTAAISRDAHSWLRDEGIWWRFLTDSDRIQGVWWIDAVERKLPQLSICLCRRVPASSSNLSSSPSLDIFVEHIHYIQMIKVTTLDSVNYEALSKISGDWQWRVIYRICFYQKQQIVHLSEDASLKAADLNSKLTGTSCKATANASDFTTVHLNYTVIQLLLVNQAAISPIKRPVTSWSGVDVISGII